MGPNRGVMINEPVDGMFINGRENLTHSLQTYLETHETNRRFDASGKSPPSNANAQSCLGSPPPPLICGVPPLRQAGSHQCTGTALLSSSVCTVLQLNLTNCGYPNTGSRCFCSQLFVFGSEDRSETDVTRQASRHPITCPGRPGGGAHDTRTVGVPRTVIGVHVRQVLPKLPGLHGVVPRDLKTGGDTD